MDPDLGERASEGGSRNGEKRVRRMCFTLNNPSPGDFEAILQWMDKETQYGVVAKEVGKSGTPHFQGYIRFKNAKCASTVRKFPAMSRSAIFYCKGTEGQNMDYCMKDGDFAEVHPEAAQRDEGKKRGDKPEMDHYAAELRDRGSEVLQEMIRDHPALYVRHSRGFLQLLSATQKERHLAAPPTCVYAFGPAGSGKSTLIHRLAEEEAEATGKKIFYWGTTFPWADGYSDEQIIVLDDVRDKDFRGQPVPINFVTKMIDRFALKLQVKGGSTQFQGDSFYLSSVMHPADMWNRDPRDPVDQILRRITDLYECDIKDGEHVHVRLGDGRTPRVGPLLNPAPLAMD